MLSLSRQDCFTKGIMGQKLLSIKPTVTDSLRAWIVRYQQVAVQGIRSQAVAQKIALASRAFCGLSLNRHTVMIGSQPVSSVMWWPGNNSCRFKGWHQQTVNNHMASLSTFATWVQAQAPITFPVGDPTKGIGELPPAASRTPDPDRSTSANPQELVRPA